MRVRGIAWRVGKWAGVAACAGVVASFAASLQYEIGCKTKSGVTIGASTGTFFVYWPARPGKPGWSFNRFPRDYALAYSLRSALWFASRFGPNFGQVSVPIWMLLIVAAIPTVFMWRVDRRRNAPGHCQQCGYDLTKNESGRCPECGTNLQRETSGATRGLVRE